MRMSFFTSLKKVTVGNTVLLAFSALGLMACGGSVDLMAGDGDRAGTNFSQTGVKASAQNVNGSGDLNESARNNQVVTVQSQNVENNEAGLPNAESVVYFDLDSYVITPPHQETVAAHARYLNADRSRDVVLEGHTDDQGGREYNLALGQKRAEAVMLVLRVLGVQPQQIEAVSFGEESPADLGNTERARAQNRRVEIRYR